MIKETKNKVFILLGICTLIIVIIITLKNIRENKMNDYNAKMMQRIKDAGESERKSMDSLVNGLMDGTINENDLNRK